MKKLVLSAALASIVLPGVTSAQSFAEQIINVRVNPTEGGAFEVVEEPFLGPAQMWCAAGIYARHVLKVSRGQLYISEGYGPAKTRRGGRGVSFTTKEVPGAFTSFSANYRRAGLTKSLGTAIALCESDRDLRIRIRTAAGRFSR